MWRLGVKEMLDNNLVKAELEERLKSLNDQIADLQVKLRAPHSRDSEERAIERESDEVLEELERNALEEIAHVRAALERIGEGSYGLCVNCGQPIGEARLKALTYATNCIDCAA